MNKKKFISLGLLTSITFLSSSCNIVKNQNEKNNNANSDNNLELYKKEEYKPEIDKKEKEKYSKIDYLKVKEIRDLTRNKRPSNLNEPHWSNMAEYLDVFPNHDSKFYNDEYIVIKNIEEFEKIYKYSKISEIYNKRNYYKSFYKRIEHLKNDSELHLFFKKEFENDFLKGVKIEEILKENNVFLIGTFYRKNEKKNKIKTFGLGTNNKNSNKEIIKILFFDKKYWDYFFTHTIPMRYPLPPHSELEVHIIPKSKEIKIELLETEDEILNYHKELLEYNKNNN